MRHGVQVSQARTRPPRASDERRTANQRRRSQTSSDQRAVMREGCGHRAAIPDRSTGPSPRAAAAAVPGSTPAAPSSRPPPSSGRSQGDASPSTATGPGDAPPPSPTRTPGLPPQRRPRGRWRVRRRGGAVASCAPQPVERHRRLGEAHRDRKVVGGGAIPLAPTIPGWAACCSLDPSSGQLTVVRAAPSWGVGAGRHGTW